MNVTVEWSSNDPQALREATFLPSMLDSSLLPRHGDRVEFAGCLFSWTVIKVVWDYRLQHEARVAVILEV